MPPVPGGRPDQYGVPVTRRDALRVLAVTAGTPLLLLMSSPPALAVTRDDGDDPGTPMSTLGWIGLYVLLPIALFGLIALAVYAPSLARGPRYRPDVNWWAEPVWFEGPARQLATAGAGAGAGAGVDGAESGTSSGGATALGADPPSDVTGFTGGGASARW